MENMDPVKRTRFCNSFRAVVEDIAYGLSTSRASASDGHWEKLAAFCRNVEFYPIPLYYRYPAPILNTFASKYRTGAIAPIGH